MKERMPLPISD